MALPIIDVSSFGGPQVASQQIRALRTACESHGFFLAAHHGVSTGLQQHLEVATERFFALPTAEKQQITMSRGGRAWRGYFTVGAELTSGRPDLKEGLYFGTELPESDPRVRAGLPLHGGNLFPPQVTELKTAVLQWLDAQEALAQRLMSAIALSLELPHDFFSAQLTRDPLCLFRIFHYPAPAADQVDAWGVGEHTDYGLLTVLKQDDCGGLEVKTREGWLDVPALPDVFVCNLGDMLDRMTGGLYRSTPHRVRNRAGRSRYSWPFFFDPSFSAEVRPLPMARVRPSDVDAAERWDHASVHELSGTYGAYLLSKVSKVFPQLQGHLTAG